MRRCTVMNTFCRSVWSVTTRGIACGERPRGLYISILDMSCFIASRGSFEINRQWLQMWFELEGTVKLKSLVVIINLIMK